MCWNFSKTDWRLAGIADALRAGHVLLEEPDQVRVWVEETARRIRLLPDAAHLANSWEDHYLGPTWPGSRLVGALLARHCGCPARTNRCPTSAGATTPSPAPRCRRGQRGQDGGGVGRSPSSGRDGSHGVPSRRLAMAESASSTTFLASAAVMSAWS